MSKYHFIAIGGAIMHQLAIQLLEQGNIVTGSDDVIFDPAAQNLKNLGIYPKNLGWQKDNIHEGIDYVILGMHAKADNSELLEAQRLNIPIYSFPEFIAKLSQNKTRIVVAGSHGKTTTTSMIMYSLKKAGVDFDYLVGSKVKDFPLSVKITKDAPIIVIEGDEYLTSPIDKRSKFLHYKPHIAIITGIAWDHINVFPTFDSYTATFETFIKSIVDGGQLIHYQEDEHLHRMVGINSKINYTPYSIFPYKYSNGETLLIDDEKFYKVDFFGTHNMSNLAAVGEVMKSLNIEKRAWLESLEEYQIAANRLEKIYEDKSKQVVVFKDFAHAPSKVKATVKAIKEKYTDYQFITIFELHTFSSLQSDFLPNYYNSLSLSDSAAVFLSNHVLAQKGDKNINDSYILSCFGGDNLSILHESSEIESFLKNKFKPKTVVLFMSSGSFDNLNIGNLIRVND